MNDKASLPADFDFHNTVYALKGIADLVYDFHTEGRGVFLTLPQGQHVNLVGLSWVTRRLARELSMYVAMLDEDGQKMPGIDGVGGVREEPAGYGGAVGRC